MDKSGYLMNRVGNIIGIAENNQTLPPHKKRLD